MPAGRPTKLDDAMLEKAHAYVTQTSVMGVHVLLPTIEGLALELDLDRDTIYAWETVPELAEEPTDADVEKRDLRTQFSYIVRRLRLSQAQKLLQNSLVGRYNPIITKLLLSKHGYVEKSEQDFTSGGNTIKPVLVKFVGEGDTNSTAND